MSCWSQFTSVEAFYAEVDVGTPEATTRSFQDLAKSKVGIQTSNVAHRDKNHTTTVKQNDLILHSEWEAAYQLRNAKHGRYEGGSRPGVSFL